MAWRDGGDKNDNSTLVKWVHLNSTPFYIISGLTIIWKYLDLLDPLEKRFWDAGIYKNAQCLILWVPPTISFDQCVLVLLPVFKPPNCLSKCVFCKAPFSLPLKASKLNPIVLPLVLFIASHEGRARLIITKSKWRL